MATITNQSVNTATPTNVELTQTSLLVRDATFTVGEASGFVGAPYGIQNRPRNNASITNNPES